MYVIPDNTLFNLLKVLNMPLEKREVHLVDHYTGVDSGDVVLLEAALNILISA